MTPRSFSWSLCESEDPGDTPLTQQSDQKLKNWSAAAHEENRRTLLIRSITLATLARAAKRLRRYNCLGYLPSTPSAANNSVSTDSANG